MSSVCVILSAGGIGSRMGSSTPKQFLNLNGKVIARYSFDLFLAIEEVKEIVVVCAPDYRHHFEGTQSCKKITFADPGKERQDSVYNGLKSATTLCDLVCVHDAARPFIDIPLVKRVVDAAEKFGAATVGMPLKFTLKESAPNEFVSHTPDRSKMWEIQTPQVIRRELLKAGFEAAHRLGFVVTDDVSLVEHLKKPVKLVEGSYKNLKITTPEDLALATLFTSQER